VAPEKLSRAARLLFDEPNDNVFLSAATVWEISIKSASGKLDLPESARTYVARRSAPAGLSPLSITHEHAVLAGELPRHHMDPFDRMLIAQAQTENMVLVTADRRISQYSVQTLWAGK
jgi:PIN domain nuclease of toxin-antitoxin system